MLKNVPGGSAFGQDRKAAKHYKTKEYQTLSHGKQLGVAILRNKSGLMEGNG